MRTGNPTLSDKAFADFTYVDRNNLMTLEGTVQKTTILLLLVVGFAAIPWYLFFTTYNTGLIWPFVIGGSIGGLVLVLVSAFKKEWSSVTAPLYACLEGLALGGISASFEALYPTIVLQAVALTFGTLFGLLAAYQSGWIKATENFKLGVVAATGGIFLVYMATFILGLFGISVPFIHDNGWLGIGISLFIVVIAALNLVLDFDFIENGVEHGAPKYMEWYASLGLMVTLVWLYIEILRLLAKLNSRE